jgi:hypothetical protein
MEPEPLIFGVQGLPNGYWLVRAPTGDPVGLRVDVLDVVKGADDRRAEQRDDRGDEPKPVGAKYHSRCEQ